MTDLRFYAHFVIPGFDPGSIQINQNFNRTRASITQQPLPALQLQFSQPQIQLLVQQPQLA